MAIQEELSKHSAKFEENLLDATNAWSKFIEDEAELAGLPDDAKAMFREMAEADGSLANSQVSSSTCKPPPSCPSCSTAKTAACARRCTAPTPPAPRNTERKPWTTRR
jgi:Zn-dependent oligopeptidase